MSGGTGCPVCGRPKLLDDFSGAGGAGKEMLASLAVAA